MAHSRGSAMLIEIEIEFEFESDRV